MSVSFPSADFAPTLSGYTGQGAFRFWCQKVLPIVYDDSLSYYELLNKVVAYLNNVIKDVADCESNIDSLLLAYKLLEEYVNNYTLVVNPATVEEILSRHPEWTTTVQDGSISERKLTKELRDITFNYYVTPEMFGGVGDGESDDTEAFVTACSQGKPVVVTNSLINDCSVHDVDILFLNCKLTGNISCYNVRICGNIEVDGGGFIVDRLATDLHGRDNSIFYNLNFKVVTCYELFVLQGTLYNVKFSNINIEGKVSGHVIRLTTAEWLTYTIIESVFFGSCDNPIYLEDNSANKNGIGDIYVVNSYAQRYNPVGECHFVNTNSKGLLVCDGSFMYDLNTNEGDSEIYIRRNSNEVGYFNIVVKNKNIAPNVLLADSKGNRGYSLLQEIGYEPGEINGDSLLSRKFMRNPPFYNFVANGYGTATDVYLPTEDVLGTMYKAGNAISGSNRELVVGMVGSTGKLGSVYRGGTGITPVKRTYDSNEDSRLVASKAQIDLYGQGVCLFYTPLRKVVCRWGNTYYDSAGNDVTGDIT